MLKRIDINRIYGFDRIIEIEGDSKDEVNTFVNSTLDHIAPAYFPTLVHAAVNRHDSEGNTTGKWFARYSVAKKV